MEARDTMRDAKRYGSRYPLHDVFVGFYTSDIPSNTEFFE